MQEQIVAGPRERSSLWTAHLTLLGVALASVALYFIIHSLVIFLVGAAVGFAVVASRIGLRNSVGVFLLLMIVQYLAIALLQFYGVRQYKEISAIKDVILLAAPVWYLTQVRSFRIVAADLVLAIALLYVLASQIFRPGLEGARVDWEWVLPYFLGRLMVLRPEVQALWAKCAVWMCAALSVFGAWEIFVLGPQPRTLLVNVTLGERQLNTGFFATGYDGFRAASTTVSPLSFGAFCMVALILWWVYMRNPVLALLVGAGLVLALTRSAILMAGIGVAIVAARRRERLRILWLVATFAVGLAIAIPTLNLQKFLSATFSAHGDVSLEGHKSSLSEGIARMADNPLGTGAGTVGPRVLQKSSTALNIESSYLTIAIEYGVFPGAMFVIFIGLCLWRLSKIRSSIGYAAFAVLLGFALLLGVGPANQDLAVSCWVWFVVGQGMTDVTDPASPDFH